MSKRSTSWFFLVLVLVAALYTTSPISIASAADTTTSATNTTTGAESDDSSSGGGAWYIPGWVTDLMNDFRSMGQTFNDLMSGKLIKDAIQGVIVAYVDEALTPLYGTFAKSYLFTPRVAEVALVYKTWSVLTIGGVIALLIGINILGFNVLRGKKELKTLLKSFLVALLALILSLTILNFVNVGINWLTQEAMEGIIGTNGIMYQWLDGESIMKALVLGKDGLTDPAYAQISLGEIVVQSDGGLITLVMFISNVVAPLFLLSVIKTLVLMLLAMFVAVWIVRAAYTGKLEILVGFLNIFARTQIVGFVCALHWAIYVKMQTDYGVDDGFAASIGVPPIIFAIISVLFIIVWLVFFWVKPLFKAVAQPGTLNGGAVVERMGKRAELASLALNGIGKRLGAEGLQRRGLGWAQSARKLADVGQKMQQNRTSLSLKKAVSSLTGGASEVLQGVTYEMPILLSEPTGTVHRDEAAAVKLEPGRILSSKDTVRASLAQIGFAGASMLSVPESERADLSTLLPSLQRYGVEWNRRTGQLLMPSAHREQVLTELSMAQFSISPIQHGLSKDGLFINPSDGTQKVITATPKATGAQEAVKAKLPTFAKVQLPPAEAKQAYAELTRSSTYSWAGQLQLKGDELFVPEALAAEAKEAIQAMKIRKTKLVRFEMPQESRFLPRMATEWKEEGVELLEEVDEANNAIFVHEDNVAAFQAKLGQYHQEHTPFWQTKDGRIKVIVEGMPVDYGSVPLKGLDMGSFEALQDRMLRKHQAAKAKGG